MHTYLRNIKASWTIWFNSIMITLMELIPYLHDTFTEIQPYMPDNIYKTLALVLIVGNIALRFKTNSSLGQVK